jgi:hypothetical protein
VRTTAGILAFVRFGAGAHAARSDDRALIRVVDLDDAGRAHLVVDLTL